MVTCWNCKHWEFVSAEPAWSDITPGIDACFSCNRGCWWHSGSIDHATVFGLTGELRKQRNCLYYNPLS